MTYLAERLADLRRHLDHLEELEPRVTGTEQLRGDLSLHNDVLYSLLRVCQCVVDVAGELASRRGLRFQDYTEAVRALARIDAFPEELVERLAPLPGFRNVLVHEYVELDYGRVLRAMEELAPVRRFVEIAARLEAGDGGGGEPEAGGAGDDDPEASPPEAVD